MSFKPTLAVNAEFSKINWSKGMYASPKLDGIRCSIVDGKALSRTLKPIPNKHIYEQLSRQEFNGLDGELIVGSPTSPTCYADSVSNVMSFDKVPAYTYYVFDCHDIPEATYRHRLESLNAGFTRQHPVISVLGQTLLSCEQAMLIYEDHCVGLGYEGIILRDPEAPYKFGRSTVKEQFLLKVKRFIDQDAEIIGVVEEMFNGNEEQTNELGRTKRSTSAAGLSGKGSMGALHVRDLVTGIDFHIGTGFTAADRAAMWATPPIGELCKYKHFPVGQKDKPRHPVFIGLRSKLDI